ncbi:hypothetical protein HMPREF9336_04379 [Segniliparus rugosus ATCC BAA-974]|uniref:Uncharacterized protein n=2 Tax=Segniliparus rugosus TaxID=286804 RepID=U1M2B5_SEGRC|nr:hypothetical protein HMPREF9336_04379 [Segniliparus rugosus ATCC BAA-974]
MPVAPRIRTVPSPSTSSARAISGIHEEMPGLMPAATWSGSAPCGSATAPPGATISSARVP